MLPLYSTYYLQKIVVPELKRMPKLFSSWFPQTILSDKREIFLDRKKSTRPRLTPFVAPMMQGRLVERLGYSTDKLRPAYIKDLREFDPWDYQQRVAGEQFGGELTLDQRMEQAIVSDMQDMMDMYDNRIEVMCAEAVIHGTQTIIGDGFHDLVDYRRNPANHIALAGSDKWDTLPATPTKEQCLAFLRKVFHQLESWATMMRDAIGSTPTVVIMDSKSWDYIANAMALCDSTGTMFDRNDKRYDRIMAKLDPTMASEMGLSVKGTFGDFTIATFQAEYDDPEDGQTKRVMPDNTVIMVNVSRMDGVKHFGAIMDINKNIGYPTMKKAPYHIKSWSKEDPVAQYIMLQSSPLMVPYEPNAVLKITVA